MKELCSMLVKSFNVCGLESRIKKRNVRDLIISKCWF